MNTEQHLEGVVRIGIYLGRHAGHGGGIGVYARGYIRSLLALLEARDLRGFEIVLYGDRVTLDRPFFDALESAPRGAGARVRVRFLPSFPGRKLNVLLDQLSLPILAAYDGLDLIHSLANVSPVLSSRPQVVTVHDLFQAFGTEGSARGAVPAFYRFVFRRQFRRARRVITDGAAVAAEISRRYSVPADRIVSIPLGLDSPFLEAARCSSASELERRTLALLDGLSLRSGHIFFFAASDPRKNYSNIEAAVRLLARKKPELGFACRPLDPSAEGAVRSLCFSIPNLVILPWMSREELLYLALSAGVVCVPTLGEGFGFPALEGLACGAHVVSGPLDYFAETAPPGLFLCDPRSPDSILRAIETALGVESAVLSIGERASRLKDGRDLDPRLVRTLEDTARESCRVYGDVLREGGRASGALRGEEAGDAVSRETISLDAGRR